MSVLKKEKGGLHSNFPFTVNLESFSLRAMSRYINARYIDKVVIS